MIAFERTLIKNKNIITYENKFDRFINFIYFSVKFQHIEF